MKTFFLLRMSIIALLPIFLSKYKKEPSDNLFKLTNLSKILLIVVIFQCIRFVMLNNFSLSMDEYFWFIRIGEFILSSALIGAVLWSSPTKNLVDRLTFFPTIEISSKFFVLVAAFFLFACLSTYLRITEDRAGILFEQGLYLSKMIANPYTFIIFLLFLDFFAVVGEELVARYFAINSLRAIFGINKTIIMSSVLWTLMHKTVDISSLGIGIFLAFLYIRTESLSICILLHFIFNMAIFSESVYLYLNPSVVPLSPFQFVIGIFFISIILFVSIGRLLSRKAGK